MDTSRFPSSLLREVQNFTEILPSLFIRGAVIGVVLMTTFWIAIRIAALGRLPASLQLRGFWFNVGYIFGGTMYFSIVSSALTLFGKANWNIFIMVIALMPFWHVIVTRSFLLWRLFSRLRLAPLKDDDEMNSLQREIEHEPKTGKLKTGTQPANNIMPKVQLAAKIKENSSKAKLTKKTRRNRRSK